MALLAQTVTALGHAVERRIHFAQQAGQARVARRRDNRRFQPALALLELIVQETDFERGHENLLVSLSALLDSARAVFSGGRSSRRSSRSRCRPPPCSASPTRPSSPGETLTVEFPESASFHRQLAEDPKNAVLLQDALYEVTGRRLALAFATGEGEEPAEHHERPMGEDEIFELMKETFDAREVEEP